MKQFRIDYKPQWREMPVVLTLNLNMYSDRHGIYGTESSACQVHRWCWLI